MYGYNDLNQKDYIMQQVVKLINIKGCVRTNLFKFLR